MVVFNISKCFLHPSFSKPHSPKTQTNITEEEEHILSDTLAYSDPTNNSLVDTTFLNATYLEKARTNTFYIHTDAQCAHICFRPQSLKADSSRHTHIHTVTLHIPPRPILEIYITMQTFVSAAPEECCSSINMGSVCAFTAGL